MGTVPPVPKSVLAGVIVPKSERVEGRDSRRRTDGSGEAVSWSARRDIAIAEEAYRLFVERGRDRSRADECWQAARTKVSDTSDTSDTSETSDT